MTVVKRIESFSKSLPTFWAEVTLCAFTGLTMFMRLLMVAQRTFHCTATNQLHFFQSSSPTLPPRMTVWQVL